MKSIYLAVAATLFLSSYVEAETFKYQSGMSIELGSAWNPLAPNDISGLGQCVITTVSEVTPVATEKFSEGFAETFQQLQSMTSLSFSASGSGNYGIASVSGSALYDNLREAFRSNRSIVYVVTGRRTYNPLKLASVKLSENGAKFLAESKANSDPETFVRECGEALVTSVTKETSISLTYIFTTSNAATRDRVRAAISASVSSGLSSGSMASSIMNEVSHVDAATSVTMEVIQSGAVDQNSTVRNLVGTQPGAINEIRDGLRKAIAAITWESSPIVSFSAERLERHLAVPKSSNWDYIATVYSRVDNIRETADRLARRYFQLTDVLSDADTQMVTLRPGAREQIITEMESITTRLEDFVSTARSCFNHSEVLCKSPYIDVSQRVLSYINVPFGSFSSWKAEAHGDYISKTERIATWAEFWPEFILQNLKYMRSVDLYRDNAKLVHMESDELGTAVLNGILSYESRYKARYSNSEYCWSGRWGEECDPWAANDTRHKNDLKTLDKSTYRLEVIDIEGNKVTMAVPPLRDTTFY